MSDTGITRFNITDRVKGRGAWRFKDAKKCWPAANELYREIFGTLGMPLLPGEETIDCTLKEFEAGYDYQLGIDVILRSQGQGESTMQEKFLFTHYDTVTVEHCQNWLELEPGDWYKLKTQYYFVGYAKQYSHFDPWMLLEWSRLKRATAQRRIPWRLKSNDRNGARSSFMFVKFEEIPWDIPVTSSNRPYSLF